MLKETDYSFQQQQEESQIIPTITKDIVVYSKVQIDHLLCPICLSIIWDPVTCGSNGCFSSFCSSCISVWLRRTEQSIQAIQYDSFLNNQIQNDNRKCCPKCKRPFKKICIPLLKSLLQCLILKCIYYKNGCTQEIEYNQFHNHTSKCTFRKTRCEGCLQKILKKQYQEHVKNCQLVLVKCERCGLSLIRSQFSNYHTNIKCYEKQVNNKDSRLENVQNQLDEISSRMNYLQNAMNKLIKGESMQLKIEFYTTFTQHFSFPNITLIKPSFNAQKQKFDFLHFYIITPLRVFSPIGIQWKLRINKLIGNLLIGFCSTMCPNSIDYIINKFGQLKKKQANESKYKLIRKTFFEFGQGDIIQFRYNVNFQYLKIENETKNLSMKLDTKEILQIGPTIYTFISMDTLNDSVNFI